ncbi:MAG: flavin reductase protein [Solirubrobacterales bacterium]|nr:flavin reductase protein [Solirubrobacterales bacterium]
MEFFGEEEAYGDAHASVGLDGSAFHLHPAPSGTPAKAIPRARSVSDSFRETMRALASGVVLITTEVGGRPWGVTVTSCCSLSVDPPRLLVSLMRNTATCQSILAGGTFGVDLLGDAHKRVAQFGSARGAPKFLDTEPGISVRGGTLAPMVDGALSHVDCELEQVYDGDDHSIIVGRVVDVVLAHPHSSASPLLYFDGGFFHLGGPL